MSQEDHTIGRKGDAVAGAAAGPSQRPLVAVLILNWEIWPNTLECLRSLEGITYPKQNVGIFVIDNGSQNDSVSVLRNQLNAMRTQGWRDLALVENSENIGFARGNNAGYTRIPPEYELVYLSNDDIVFYEDCLEHVAEAFARYESAGVVGAKVLTYDAPHVLSHGAGYVRPLLLGTRSENTETPTYCHFVTGCALCIRRSVVEQLGTFFDPAFIAYWEDTDLCARVRAAGYGILYCPEARVLHKVSTSTGGIEGLISPVRAYRIMHGKTLYARKHLSLLSRGLFYALFAVRFPWFVLRTTVLGGRGAPVLWGAYLRGVRDGVSTRLDE